MICLGMARGGEDEQDWCNRGGKVVVFSSFRKLYLSPINLINDMYLVSFWIHPYAYFKLARVPEISTSKIEIYRIKETRRDN